MTEQEILSYFNDRPAPANTTDLHRIRFLCNELHNPQDALKGRFLHVAGTNGKGSTCAYLDAVLRVKGMRTGLFISPFIHTFEERIQIDGAPVSLAEIEAALPLLQKAEKKLFLKHRETAGHFERRSPFFSSHSTIAILLFWKRDSAVGSTPPIYALRCSP